MKEEISIFKQHTFEILSFIETNQPCQKSTIYEHLGGNNKTRTEIVNELIQIGLIEESKKGRHNIKIITLTDKGKNILEEMRKINAIINGEDILDSKTNHGPSPEIHVTTEI